MSREEIWSRYSAQTKSRRVSPCVALSGVVNEFETTTARRNREMKHDNQHMQPVVIMSVTTAVHSNSRKIPQPSALGSVNVETVRVCFTEECWRVSSRG